MIINNNIGIQEFPIGCTFILREKEISLKNAHDGIRPSEEHACLPISDNTEHCSCVSIFSFIAIMY